MGKGWLSQCPVTFTTLNIRLVLLFALSSSKDCKTRYILKTIPKQFPGLYTVIMRISFILLLVASLQLAVYGLPQRNLRKVSYSVIHLSNRNVM
ncbi:hypothetical protein BDQ17DRAFT_627897 [Cyathus striatus]|nr:hypothetical protein BDQ17DRAFT_627897 [Cyathus striatus]